MRKAGSRTARVKVKVKVKVKVQRAYGSAGETTGGTSSAVRA